ncbi:MAG: hypothetical protein L0K90_01995 [Staphylococcus equorum]|nr:hypothetical protein [Staphylococcus equorum]
MDKMSLQKQIGNYCKEFRETKMKISINELSEITHVKYKTLYSFESGLSSNIMMINHYIVALNYDKGLQLGFVQGLNDLLGSE